MGEGNQLLCVRLGDQEFAGEHPRHPGNQGDLLHPAPACAVLHQGMIKAIRGEALNKTSNIDLANANLSCGVGCF